VAIDVYPLSFFISSVKEASISLVLHDPEFGFLRQ
jgi:hypothetical protein